VDEVAYTVIGVLPDRFVIPFSNANHLSVWVPAPRDGKDVFPTVLARVRPEVTDAALRERLNAPMAAMTDMKGRWLSQISRPQDDLGRATKDSLLVLFGAVAVVLLAGAVNVANLLLARAQARQREFLVRRALGAGQGRLVRQLLTESSLLALMGWAGGVALAFGGLSLAQAYRPASLAALERVTIEPALLLASLGVSGVTALLFGLAPALLAGSRKLADDLRRQSLSASPDRRAARWRAGLVVAEVAMSALLLVGGGLLIRTLIEMQGAPLGFDADGVYAVELDLSVDRYPDAPAQRALLDQVLPRLAAEPSIQAVAPAMGGPSQPGATFGSLEVEGGPAPSTGGSDVLGFNAVAPGYFQLTGTPLTEGREFDADSEPNVAIVSAALARRLQPNGSAVGVRFRLDAKAPWRRVIGVAGDVTVPRPGGRGGLTEVMYVPFTASFRQAGFVLRTNGEPAGLQASVRGVVQSLDPTIRVLTIQSARSVADDAQALPRFIAGILTMFAAVAVVMSAIGLYGVIAYSVTRRWREIGIRLALGAQSADVLQSVVGTGLLMVAAGLVVGLGAAYFLAGSLRSVLFGVAPIDAVTFVAAAALIALVAGAAVFLPAQRATGIDPISVLREP
jgi:putative ABC transport system permease protein